VSTTIYISRSARDQIDAARRTAGTHLVRAATGRCQACDVEWPCLPHLEAAATLNRYGHLPTRTPGATLDVQGRPTSPPSPAAWFGGVAGR
jgi:hypothetical protein